MPRINLSVSVDLCQKWCSYKIFVATFTIRNYTTVALFATMIHRLLWTHYSYVYVVICLLFFNTQNEFLMQNTFITCRCTEFFAARYNCSSVVITFYSRIMQFSAFTDVIVFLPASSWSASYSSPPRFIVLCCLRQYVLPILFTWSRHSLQPLQFGMLPLI
jgi:hypothetical protein